MSSRRPIITDIRPFRGLRYDPERVTPDHVVAPPFDVVSDADVTALHASSPYNIAHVESSRGPDADRFDAAAAALRRWQEEGVLVRDEQPAYYAYEQRFTLRGAVHTRRAFFAAVRLYRPEERVVRPHEGTMSGPRRERLALMRATGANISPIFSLYRDPDRTAAALLTEVVAEHPDFQAEDTHGDHHRLWVIDAPRYVEALTAVLAHSNVTIADGHHRYATALTFHAERGDPASGWVMMGLVASDDPGLLILPYHRLVQLPTRSPDLLERLSSLYTVEDVTPKSWDGTAVQRLWGRVQAGAGGLPTFGLLGLEEQHLHLLTARSREDIDRAMPPHLVPACRGLDVHILTETILKPVLGLRDDDLVTGDRISFTEDVEEAWQRTEQKHNLVGFLVNPTRVDQVLAVADAGELMPQKATFFYPKLGTGLVMNVLD